MSDEVETQAGEQKKSQFSVQNIVKIPNLSVEELTELEKEILDEFRDISKSYLATRLSRIDTLIEKINNLIKITTANDRNWLKIYNFEIETINNIKTNTEDLVLLSGGYIHNRADILRSIDEYEEELKEIFKNLQSPLDFDETLGDLENENNNNDENSTKLPFAYLFERFFKPHTRSLQTIINEKDYQSRLLQNNSSGNSAIIWKLYYYNLMRRKHELVQQTFSELNNLYKEYHSVNDQQQIARGWSNYYRSVISPIDLRRTYDEGNNNKLNHTIYNTTNTHDYKTILENNRDSNYSNLDNLYLQKNRIELTNIRKNIFSQQHRFNHTQNRDSQTYLLDTEEPAKKRVKLNTCLGLVKDEIDDDLSLLRKEIRKHKQLDEPEVEEEIQVVDAVAKENSPLKIEEGSENENENEIENDDDDVAEDDLEDEELEAYYNGMEYEYDDDDNDDDNDEDDDEDDYSDVSDGYDSDFELLREEREIKYKYKQLLGLDSGRPSSGLTILDLPPLELFPPLQSNMNLS